MHSRKLRRSAQLRVYSVPLIIGRNLSAVRIKRKTKV